MHTLHTKSFELFKYLVDTIITVKITYKPAIIIKAKKRYLTMKILND